MENQRLLAQNEVLGHEVFGERRKEPAEQVSKAHERHAIVAECAQCWQAPKSLILQMY